MAAFSILTSTSLLLLFNLLLSLLVANLCPADSSYQSTAATLEIACNRENRMSKLR